MKKYKILTNFRITTSKYIYSSKYIDALIAPSITQKQITKNIKHKFNKKQYEILESVINEYSFVLNQ